MANEWKGTPVRCVVMCGGKSTRFSPSLGHKSMALVKGVPLIERVITAWTAYTDDFIFVVKHGKEHLIEFVETLPIKSEFVEPDALRGIADGLSYVEPLISDRFILVLGDCFHSGEFETAGGLRTGIGVLPSARPEQIRRNYAVFVRGDRVVRVEEKPERVETDLCGLGFYFFQADMFDYIRRTPPSPRTNELEITDVLQTMIDGGVDMKPVMLRGQYVNVTSEEDLGTIEAVLEE